MLPLSGNSKERMGGFLAIAKTAGFDFVELRTEVGDDLAVQGEVLDLIAATARTRRSERDQNRRIAKPHSGVAA